MNSKRWVIGEAVSAGLILAVFWWVRWPDAAFSIFQVRDLERARQVASGSWFLFGPEMTGGGHLPGGLYYWLLSGPMKFFANWKGAWFLLVAMTGAGAALGWYVFRRKFGFAPALIFFSGIASSQQISRAILDFNNASFISIFFICCLISLCLTFVKSSKPAGLWWTVAALCIGLGAQIHMSITLFLAGGFLLQLLAPRFGLRRVPGGSFALGLAAAAMTLIPYALYSTFALGEPALNYTGGMAGVFDFFQGHSLRLFTFFDLEPAIVLKDSASAAQSFLPQAAILLSGLWLAFGRFDKKTDGFEWLKVAAVLFAVSAIAVSPFIAGHVYLRYGTGVSITLCALIGISASLGGRLNLRDRRFIGGTLVVFAVTLAMLPSPRRAFLKKPSVTEMESMIGAIVEQTSWNYEVAKERIYLINVHSETSFEELFREQPANPAISLGQPAPDGYFVAMAAPEDLILARKSFAKFLKKYGADDIIHHALASGGLQLGDLQKISPRMLLVPYTVSDKFRWPAHFHNIGESYRRKPEESVAAISARAANEPARVAAVTFNHCPQKQSFCSVVLSVESENLKDPRYPIVFRAQGPPITFPSPWISPSWTESLKKPYLLAECADKNVKIEAAEAIGFDPLGNVRLRNSSILGPFQRTIQVNCRGPIRKVTLGFRESHGGTLHNNRKIPGDERAVAIR